MHDYYVHAPDGTSYVCFCDARGHPGVDAADMLQDVIELAANTLLFASESVSAWTSASTAVFGTSDTRHIL